MSEVPRVLVLEDHPELTDAIVLILSSEGFDVRLTASGVEALRLVAREPFDLVLADLEVEELSGPGVWHGIRDLADVPVVAMSASGGRWQEEAFRAGVAACQPKPFAIDDLLGLVEVMLGAPSGGGIPPWDVEDLSDADLRRLAALDRAALDRLPFGLIEVDRDGRIVGFNAYEENASRFAAATVLGRRFEEIAPCTRVRTFAREVAAALDRPGESRSLRFRFPFRGATDRVA